MTPPPDQELEHLLDYVRDNRGFDFTGYKRASLTRRIRRRMQDVGIETFAGYQDHLEVHPDEFANLFNTILINVTGFFRDPAAWDFVAQTVLPEILARRGDSDPLRIWSVGCASGEEAYTLAMILAEAVGRSALRDRVKIYATDVDEEALAHARAGVFDAQAIEPIPEPLRERYLEAKGDAFAFKKDLRRTVIFGRHDLLNDAPISRVDLIVCRNTLMYFNSDVQSRIYNGFHFALNPSGYLFLGKSEMLLTRTNIFTPVDMKLRIFQRVSKAGEPPRGRDFDYPRLALEQPDEILRAAVFESAATAQILVSPEGQLIAVNTRAESLLGTSPSDVGRPFHELEVSYRPVELRSRMERATDERRQVREVAVPWTTRTGEHIFVDVDVTPLIVRDVIVGLSITFIDVTRSHEMRSELERSRRELETAYEEIQSTVEELETTNEELQSTNEELETTNEELQSTNEELETMNEGLQSTNAELETINTELHQRTTQLNQANVFLESILESLGAGVVVVDRDLTIESWNSLAEDLWGLRAEEVRGKNLLALDIGLPVGELRPQLRDVIAGKSEVAEAVLDATNRRGRSIRCKVTITPMNDGGRPSGAIVLTEPVE